MKPRRLLFLIALLLSGSSLHAAVKQVPWGSMPDGKAVHLYTLENATLRVQLSDLGARIVSLDAPDRAGKRTDIVLGFDNAAQYMEPKAYFGATVGRYANRIARGTFTLEGRTYHVPLNNNANAMHGGPGGFSTRLWRGRAVGGHAVEFSLDSPDGDMGFPGHLQVRVRYTLRGGSLRIDSTAATDRATVLNLTNHTYFNLHGEASGDILHELVQVQADRFTPVDSGLIPTGEVADVTGTPFDLRELTPIGRNIDDKDQQLIRAGGYDHNFVLTGAPGGLRKAAFAIDPASGRTLRVMTTEPAVQFYSGNFLNGTLKGFSGALYQKHAGFCLETQHYPDSPNHPSFPSTTLRPGKPYRSTTVFVFGIARD